MITAQQKQQLKDFHNHLNDHALQPGDAAYVPVFSNSATSLTEDPINDIAVNINFSETSSVNLLTGPRGSGKTTELKRLHQILTHDDCVVFHCDMSLYMNLTTAVEVTDFLISVMAAFSDAVQASYGKNFTHRSYTERLSEFVQQKVEIKDASFKTNVGTIKAALKDDPSFKVQLQRSLQGHVTQIVKQAHEFAQDCITFIRKHHNNPDKKVVLLVDSVEQIRGVGSEASNIYASVENLFAAHADNLRFPMLHIVYTIPPYMSALAPGVARTLGGNPVQTLPSIHVRTKDNQPDEAGLAIMRQILSKRCDQLDSILTAQQIDQLASLSGGDLRNFFRFVRQCLVKAASSSGYDLPLDQALLEQALNQFRREILIPEKDLQWLRKIDTSSEHQLSEQADLAQFARFLDAGLVLNYRNGQDWYGVNPLLRSLLDSSGQAANVDNR